MIWVPPLVMIDNAGVSCYSYEISLPQVSTQTKNFLQKLRTNFAKSKNTIFSKTAQPILMAKIYVIEGTKEVMKKNKELIPLIRRG